jgi:molybdopterin/thiamine biosynthesis adenylyltransferase
MNNNRFSRQESFFTKKGQSKIHTSKVCVVGVGGIGSHLIQQLAYLGVGYIVIIDEDKLEESNRNRVIGVKYSDNNGELKVNIAERTIKEIDQEIKVTKISKSALSEEALLSILYSDFIFGCVDNDGVRLFLNEVALAYEIPYFDISSEIKVKEKELGGRIVFINDDNPCLVCLGEIDPNEARRYLENENARKDEDAIYGVSKSKLNGSGPSVVTLNGIIASIICNEFMLHVTEQRKAFNFLTFYGSNCMIRKRNDKQNKNCYYCKTIKGQGEKADLRRYF